MLLQASARPASRQACSGAPASHAQWPAGRTGPVCACADPALTLSPVSTSLPRLAVPRSPSGKSPFAPAQPRCMQWHASPLATHLRLWYIATWLHDVLPTCCRHGPGVCRGPPPSSHPAHLGPSLRGSQVGLPSGRARGRAAPRPLAQRRARPHAPRGPAAPSHRSARRGRGVSHASQRAARRSRLANVHAAHCQKPASTSMSESPATAAPPAHQVQGFDILPNTQIRTFQAQPHASGTTRAPRRSREAFLSPLLPMGSCAGIGWIQMEHARAYLPSVT